MGTVLSQDYLTPKIGRVLSTDDPLNLGRIKVSVPGVFSCNNTDILPWISRRSALNSNLYSSVQPGDKIQLFQNPNNELSFTYQPHPEPSPEVRQLLNDSSGADLLMHRVGQNGQPRAVYANDSEGITLNNAGSVFNMDPLGAFNISNPQGIGINIDENNSIVLGNSTESEQPAVLGNELVELLTQIKEDLKNLALACMPSWTTTHLSMPLETMANNIESKLSNILSSTVNITI